MPDMNLKLGPFTLRQLCRTSHRRFDNTPTDGVVLNLQRLVAGVVVPLIERFGGVWVSSGYRSPEVNEAVGGSRNSSHLYGCAVDLHFLRFTVPNVSEVMVWLHGRPWLGVDQAIDERSSTSNWLHVSIARPGRDPRHEFLLKEPGKGYVPFFSSKIEPLVEDLPFRPR